MNLLLSGININTLLTVVAIVAALAVVFAVLIVTVSKLTSIKTDGKTEEIKDLLANANCGGCGYAGCGDFAKALAEGKADISACGPTGNDSKKKICDILGVEFVTAGEKTAIVHCAGGMECFNRFNYMGNEGCAAKNAFGGGNKACAYGCIGEGDCFSSCDYGAISVKDGVAFVDVKKCAACGKCAKNCPKKIIELIPKKTAVYIACSSKCKGKEVMNACKKGCISCGICVKNCPSGAITMDNNIPVIDYSKCTGCKICLNKCPRKCINSVNL